MCRDCAGPKSPVQVIKVDEGMNLWTFEIEDTEADMLPDKAVYMRLESVI